MNAIHTDTEHRTDETYRFWDEDEARSEEMDKEKRNKTTKANLS